MMSIKTVLKFTYLRARAWQKTTLSPVSADSANSHHCFSRVQKAKGIGLCDETKCRWNQWQKHVCVSL